MSSREFKIQVSVRRNYGEHEIEFSLAEMVTINNGQERRDAYNNLIAQLNDEVALYEELHLPHVRLPSGMGVRDNANNGHLDNFPAVGINVEFKNNKRYVSVKGGRWSKHGVAIYPECITDLPIESYDMGYTDISHLGLTAYVEMENGKPKRTVSIK